PPPPPDSKSSPSPDLGQDIVVPPHQPATGSAERAALLNAVRQSVGNSTQFRVDHLRATPRWAFFSGTEVVPLDNKELQETDLTVQALLERRAPTTDEWDVVEKWTLPTDDDAPRARFLEHLRARIARDALPKALFPRDLFQ
ncbi:MAG: hypothetical protein ABIT38_19175, partial [Gemmatimonadaceae bacterium]